MGDDGAMDPCECFWNHEVAMRRLLSLLRQSQTVCTDNECFDELPRLPGSQTSPENGMMMMLMAWVAIAVLMFLMRPTSLRNKTDSEYRNNDGDNGRPPLPPAVN